MTTIYELEKQVAPRPWVPVNLDDYPGEDEGGITQKGREDYCIARAYDGDVQLTATFIMHCSNHFMEALRALIAEHDWRMNLRYETKGEKHIPETCPTCVLIKKLETIE